MMILRLKLATRFKTKIERLNWRDVWGFSTKDCLTEISLLYKGIVMDLNYTRETWSWEDLEGETDWEEIDELIDTLVELKSKNLNIFNKENFGNHKKPDMRSKLGNMESTMDKEEMRSIYQEVEKI